MSAVCKVCDSELEYTFNIDGDTLDVEVDLCEACGQDAFDNGNTQGYADGYDEGYRDREEELMEEIEEIVTERVREALNGVPKA